MNLLFSTLIYGLSTIPILSLLKIRQISRYLCAFFIIFLGEIILTGNILGLLKQFNNVSAWFLVQGVFLLITWGVWVFFKRPKLLSFENPKLNFRSLGWFQKSILIILGFFVFAGYIILAYLIIVVPPNNIDSMLVHLVRIGYWLQHGSFTPWNSIIERQVIYPFNAQIIGLWSVLLQGTDKFAAFLQFFSVLFTALGIYCLAREIGGNRYQAGISALFYLTFPQVVLQATTTQDDLVITCFLILGSYFFLRWYKESFVNKIDFAFASISFMVSIGIKPTAFYFFIGFALFIILIFCLGKIKTKHLIQLGLTCLIAFIVLSSFSYINNLSYYKNPLGPAEFVKSESGLHNTDFFTKGFVNTGRFFYQFISLDGIPSAASEPLQNAKIASAAKFPNFVDTSARYTKDPGKPFSTKTLPGINEDFSWFGPVSFLLLIPAYIIGMIKAVKTRDLKIAYFLIIPFFLLLGIAILRPGWDPYQGRYFNPAIAISMPLVVFLFKRKPIQQLFTAIVTLLAIGVLVCSVIINDSKPLLTQATIKRTFSNPAFSCKNNFLSKYECYFGNIITPILPAKADITALDELQRLTYSSQNQYPIFSLVYKEIPPQSHIGISLLTGDWEYPYFGRQFEYKLFPITDLKSLQDVSWLNQNEIEYVIVHANNDQTIDLDSNFVQLKKVADTVTDSSWHVYYYPR